MSNTDSSTRADAGNCEREPIHIPCAIQPFGFLLALTSDWRVARASENVGEYLQLDARDLLGRRIDDLFLQEAMHEIRNRITTLRGPDAVERMFGVALLADKPPFDVSVHISGQSVVIEAEIHVGEAADQVTQVRSLLARLNHTNGVDALMREAVKQVHAFTNFDRVVVYRFDQRGDGEVVSESRQSNLESFLGLHFPASDIPAQARQLYLRNTFRIISDTESKPVAIVPAIDAQGLPLDQSNCVLRSVSPTHIQYLRNMGVRASLSISIVVEGKLWGLFACHHLAPRTLSLPQRTGAELYAGLFSLILEARLRAQLEEYERNGRAVADKLIVYSSRNPALLADAAWMSELTTDVFSSQGVAVLMSGKLSLHGLTPPREDFASLLDYLNSRGGTDVFACECICDFLPEAVSYADVASGMLVIPIPRVPRDYLILFRSESRRTVRWAGNPDKPVTQGRDGMTLSPRASFEEWRELVRQKARPFSAAEISMARALRIAVFEVMARSSADTMQERGRAQEQQQFLIAELNHRVRNILTLIRGLVSQSKLEGISIDDFVRNVDNRVQALARAHDQITAGQGKSGSLRKLIETESTAYLGDRRAALMLKGEDVLLEPDAFMVMVLVVHELITNAAKYGSLSIATGRISIEWQVDQTGDLLLHWRESGGPPVRPPGRIGFGSTIINKSIPFELSGQAAVQFTATGLEADFRIPASYISGTAPAVDACNAPEANVTDMSAALAGKRVLLVEDRLLAAMDAEDKLRSLGASEVFVAPTIRAASEALRQQIDLAVLDYAVGRENTLGIAERLVKDGVPTVFASGFGDALPLALSPTLARVPSIKKPYTAAMLLAGLVEAMNTVAQLPQLQRPAEAHPCIPSP